MTTYYVDYVNGVDTANGTSTSTPWKHCPGDQSATNVALAATPVAGDFIVFRGGITYSFATGGGNKFITIKSSGSSGGGDVTYISGHVYSTPWPDAVNRAVIDGANSSSINTNALGIIGITNLSYITIKGFEMLHQPLNGDYGFIGISGTTWSHITIDNCLLHYTNGNAIRVAGSWDITATPPNHLTIKNCNSYDSWSHLFYLAWGLDTTVVDNCIFDRHGSDPYAVGNSLANAINLSYTNLPTTTQPNTNTTFKNNDFNQTLTVATKSHILLQHNIQNLIIEKNLFHGTPRVSSIDQVGPLTNYILRDNVFNDHPTWLEGICRFFTDQGNGIDCNGIHIYNNTFVATPALEAILYFYKGNSTDTTIYTNVDIRNNIIDTDSNTYDVIHIGSNSANSGPVVQMSTFTCDYNVYNAGTKTNPFSYREVNYTLANWKTATGVTGIDAHSAVGAVSFTDRTALNFTLASSDTRAIDKGTDLTSTGFAYDKLGVTRPQGSFWDIGAYEATASYTHIPSGGSVVQGTAPNSWVAVSGSFYALPSSRSTTWQGNAGSTNIIPDPGTQVNITTTSFNGTTVPTNGTSDCKTAIMNALNGMSSGQVAFLPAGTYSIFSSIYVPTGKTLRGAGIGQTKLVAKTTWSGWGVAGFNANNAQNSNGGINLTNLTKDSFTVTTTGTSHGYSVGDIIVIDQLDTGLSGDPPVTNVGTAGTATWTGRVSGRSVGQMTKVVSIQSATSFTIEQPLYWNYKQAQTVQSSKQTGWIHDAGLESMTVDNSIVKDSNGAGLLWYCYNCWMYNVEFVYSARTGIGMIGYRNNIRGCQLHDTPVPLASNSGYGLWMRSVGSCNAIENCHFYRLSNPVLLDGSCSGNIFGYNLFEGHDQNTGRQNGAMTTHGGHPTMNLIEGTHTVGQVVQDFYWGTTSYNTFYRSRMELQTPLSTYNKYRWPIEMRVHQWYGNFLGNVLGNSGMGGNYQESSGTLFTTDIAIFALGFNQGDNASEGDTQVANKILRHGNFDYVTNTTIWNGTDNQNLAPSLYLTARPSWLPSTTAWPTYGPAFTGSGGTVAYFHTPSGGSRVGGTSIVTGIRFGGTYKRGNITIGSGGVVLGNVVGVVGVPLTPTNVSAVGGVQQVRITFGSVATATSYNVYWSLIDGVTPNNGTKITNVSSPYIQSGLPISTTFFYVVTAVNPFGESPQSTQVSATTSANTIVFPNLPPTPGTTSAIDFPIVPLQLTERLPSYFDKESNPLKLFKITNSDVLSVIISPDHRTLTVFKQNGSVVFNIKNTNIATIKSTLQAHSLTLTVATTDYDLLLNHVLVNDPSDPILTNVHYEQSLNSRFMNGIEQFLLNNINDYLNGLNEVFFKLSDADWLSLWCNYFGFSRQTGEDDPTVLTRTINGIIALKLNNFAIMKLLASQLGLTATVTDYKFLNNTFVVAFQGVNISTLPQNKIDTLLETIDLYRPAGCFPVYTVPGTYLTTNTVNKITNNVNWGTYPLASGGSVVILQHS